MKSPIKIKELFGPMDITDSNPDNTIIIGNQIDNTRIKCQHCKEEIVVPGSVDPYLAAILRRLSEREYIYIKTFPFPDRIGKIRELYEYLRMYGVIEFDGERRDIEEESTKYPGKMLKVRYIRWRIHPTLNLLRENLKDDGG